MWLKAKTAGLLIYVDFLQVDEKVASEKVARGRRVLNKQDVGFFRKSLLYRVLTLNLHCF